MKTYRTIATALVATLILAALTNAQETSHVTSLESIPPSSLAYVHVDIPGLAEIDGMKFAKAVIKEVQPEIDEVVMESWGVRPSEMMDGALIVPPVNSMQEMQVGSPDKQFVFLVSFKTSAAAKNLVDMYHKQNWKRFDAKGKKIYVNEKTNMAILHFADNAVAFSHQSKMVWFLNQRSNGVDNSRSNLAQTFANTSNGQISVGINGGAIPQDMKSALPSGFESFANLEWASIAMDLSEGVRMKHVSSFATETDAANSAKQIKNLLTTVKFQLKGMQRGLESQFANRDKQRPEIAMFSLPQLAGIRYFGKILKNVDTTQTSNRLEMEVHAAEFDATSTVFVCLAAIQAVGTSANSKFEEIASELSSK